MVVVIVDVVIGGKKLNEVIGVGAVGGVTFARFMQFLKSIIAQQVVQI